MNNWSMAILLGMAGFSQAISAVEVMGSQWAGEGELGYVATSGNTDTQNLKAKLGLANERYKWRHSLGLEGLSTSDNDTTTAERYQAFWQSDYKFAEFEYVFGRLDYETDKFSGYDYRVSETFGYGRRVLHHDNMTLDLEVGPGARQSKLESGASEDEVILRLSGKYVWNINDNAKFTQNVSFNIGEDNTVSKSVTALQASVVNNLAMKLSFTVENTSDVPAGVDKTDTETAVTLVYAF